MKKELLISHDDEASKIALIEDGRLFELHVSEQANDFVVGDLFIGKIKIAVKVELIFTKARNSRLNK